MVTDNPQPAVRSSGRLARGSSVLAALVLTAWSVYLVYERDSFAMFAALGAVCFITNWKRGLPMSVRLMALAGQLAVVVYVLYFATLLCCMAEAGRRLTTTEELVPWLVVALPLAAFCVSILGGTRILLDDRRANRRA